MSNYDSELLKNVQAVDLEMAKFFVDFCKKNQLLCYFCGGGCIGAVRHKGFIPWDDDLDFFMPRDDYEKLKELWKDTERYALLYPTELYNDHNIFVTLRDKKTTMIKPYQKGIDTVHGIAIDIFPLDGYPNSTLQRMFQIFWGLVYQLYCAQLVPKNHGGLTSLVGKVGLGLIKSPKIRYKFWKFAEKQMSKYRIAECDAVTEICAGLRYMKNRYPKEIFASALFIDFEDTKMPVPVGYDKYLRIVFGDYMKLPPEDKRVTEHEGLIIDTKRNYLVYKGEYYCNKSET